MVDYLLAAAAFAVGAGVTLLNNLITRAAEKKNADLRAVSLLFFVHMTVSLLYLAAVWLFAHRLGYNEMVLLVGGVLGITLPSIVVSINNAKKAKK